LPPGMTATFSQASPGVAAIPPAGEIKRCQVGLIPGRVGAVLNGKAAEMMKRIASDSRRAVPRMARKRTAGRRPDVLALPDQAEQAVWRLYCFRKSLR